MKEPKVSGKFINAICFLIHSQYIGNQISGQLMQKFSTWIAGAISALIGVPVPPAVVEKIGKFVDFKGGVWGKVYGAVCDNDSGKYKWDEDAYRRLNDYFEENGIPIELEEPTVSDSDRDNVEATVTEGGERKEGSGNSGAGKAVAILAGLAGLGAFFL